jgi:hypothetical protein
MLTEKSLAHIVKTWLRGMALGCDCQGMQAANDFASWKGEPPAYSDAAFSRRAEEFGRLADDLEDKNGEAETRR